LRKTFDAGGSLTFFANDATGKFWYKNNWGKLRLVVTRLE
jgi:hypothetical protein